MDTKNRGIAWTLLASILWGTTFPFIGFGLEYTDSYTLLFLRFATASVAVIFIALVRRDINIIPALKKPGTWILGIVWGLGFLMQFVGQADSTAAEASLLSDLYPAIVPVLAFALLKEKIGNNQKIATVLGIVGLIMVMYPNLTFTSSHLPGDLILVSSSVFYALFIVLGKKGGPDETQRVFSLVIVLTIVLSIPAVLKGNLGSVVSIGMGWAAILWLALPGTILATLFYFRGLSSLSASQSATVLFTELISGFILSVAIFGEADILLRAAGAAVISIAIVLSAMQAGISDIKSTSSLALNALQRR